MNPNTPKPLADSFDEILKDLQIKSFHAGKDRVDYKFGANRQEAKAALIALFKQYGEEIISVNNVEVDFICSKMLKDTQRKKLNTLLPDGAE